MANSLELVNKQNQTVNVFTVPVGTLPNEDNTDTHLWSFGAKHAMDDGLYESVIVSAVTLNDAYTLFLSVLRRNTQKSYLYEGVTWYVTCEGVDLNPQRSHKILSASIAATY